MARFGQFMKEQLMPEDPMDWIILILVLGVAGGGIILIIIMYSSGLI
ncbi:MAG: hypothetical protein IT395_05620 [Candidatus Omnitrophica bacterium]|nr:hypothetical protein [Candidatus Omnitrophota bacterium]